MKKIFLTLTALFLTMPVVAIENNSVLNLATDNSYVIPLKTRPQNLQNSNTRIAKVDAITGITEEDSSILITTIEEGIAYITYKENETPVTIKILIDNKAEQDKELIILDKPKGTTK